MIYDWFDTRFVQEALLGAIALVLLLVIYGFEERLRALDLDPVEKPYRRAVFYAQLSGLSLIIILLYFLAFGGATDTMRLVAEVIFWIIVGSILFTLVVLLLRYFMLMGCCFCEFQIGDRIVVPKEIDELDDAELPMVTVIVPAYNEDKVIARSILSLTELDYPNFEICAVDDGSRDATYAEACSVQQMAPDKIRVLTQPNGGKSSALNNGIKNARGDFVLCMDADSTMAPNTLKAMIRHMLADPGLGAVAGAVKVKNRDLVITKLQALEYIQGLNIVRQAFAWAHLVSIIPGPCGLFRRRALYEVGGYDSDTFAEDCDLTLKLLMKGWRVKYEPEAQAWTEAPEDLNSLYQQRYRWTRGIIQAVMKHRQHLWSIKKGPLNTFILWYMLFETLIWPCTNMLANLMVLFVASVYGTSTVLIVWWLLLTAMDVSISMLAIGMEDEEPILVAYTFYYRLFFTLMIDVCKVLSTVEEFLGVGMDWGKLTRVGKI